CAAPPASGRCRVGLGRRCPTPAGRPGASASPSADVRRRAALPARRDVSGYLPIVRPSCRAVIGHDPLLLPLQLTPHILTPDGVLRGRVQPNVGDAVRAEPSWSQQRRPSTTLAGALDGRLVDGHTFSTASRW